MCCRCGQQLWDLSTQYGHVVRNVDMYEWKFYHVLMKLPPLHMIWHHNHSSNNDKALEAREPSEACMYWWDSMRSRDIRFTSYCSKVLQLVWSNSCKCGPPTVHVCQEHISQSCNQKQVQTMLTGLLKFMPPFNNVVAVGRAVRTWNQNTTTILSDVDWAVVAHAKVVLPLGLGSYEENHVSWLASQKCTQTLLPISCCRVARSWIWIGTIHHHTVYQVVCAMTMTSSANWSSQPVKSTSQANRSGQGPS